MLLSLVLAQALLVPPAAASFRPVLAQQSAGYRHGPDTLRYHELSRAELTLHTPAGVRLMDLTHDATVALAFGAGDTATAWYEALALEAQSLQGVRRPVTTSLLRQPFVLRLDQRGRATTLRSPALTSEILELSELSQEFTDFFVRLPVQPLGLGVEWIDTLVHTVPEARLAHRRYTAVTRWRVERDSTTADGPAWILSSQGAVTLEAGNPLPASGGRVVSVLEGEERGGAILSRDGRLLSRTKEGSLTGRLEMRASSPARSFEQGYTYWSRITWRQP
jgi:hypothetical protein